MNTHDKRIYTDQFAPSIKLNESVFIAKSGQWYDIYI